MLRSAQHKILILIAYGQRPVINVHAEVCSGVSLHLHPYFMYASSEGSGTDSSEPSLLLADTICCGYPNDCLNETFLAPKKHA